MTAQVWMAPPVSWIVSDAETRAWIQDLHNRIIGLGLVQTNDTGQIDPLTVAKPTTGGGGQTTYNDVGYLMYRFDDDLQSELPIFIKITLVKKGMLPSTIAVGSRVQIGTGTNGSGALTGSVTTEMVHAPGYWDTSTYAPVAAAGLCRASHSKERGFFGLSYSPARYGGGIEVHYAPICFAVSRTQDESGAPTAEGATLWAADGVGGGGSQFNTPGSPYMGVFAGYAQTISLSGTPPGRSRLTFPYLELPDAIGSQVPVQRTYHRSPAPSPCYNLVMYPRAAMPEGQEFALMSGGVAESNFVTLGTQCAWQPSPHTTAWAIAMLFE